MSDEVTPLVSRVLGVSSLAVALSKQIGGKVTVVTFLNTMSTSQATTSGFIPSSDSTEDF